MRNNPLSTASKVLVVGGASEGIMHYYLKAKLAAESNAHVVHVDEVSLDTLAPRLHAERDVITVEPPKLKLELPTAAPYLEAPAYRAPKRPCNNRAGGDHPKKAKAKRKAQKKARKQNRR